MSTIKDQYNKHKWTATKQRGIDFDFTFEEWCAWWEKHLGPNWAVMRGCKKGQYVMSRRGDKGPYAAHNVRCILAEHNHLERLSKMWK